MNCRRSRCYGSDETFESGRHQTAQARHLCVLQYVFYQQVIDINHINHLALSQPARLRLGRLVSGRTDGAGRGCKTLPWIPHSHPLASLISTCQWPLSGACLCPLCCATLIKATNYLQLLFRHKDLGQHKGGRDTCVLDGMAGPVLPRPPTLIELSWNTNKHTFKCPTQAWFYIYIIN